MHHAQKRLLLPNYGTASEINIEPTVRLVFNHISSGSANITSSCAIGVSDPKGVINRYFDNCRLPRAVQVV